MIVNQKFIAQEAGVSQKTVSLYFKERGLIGQKSREKIESVVKRHNYFPNLAARTMRCRRFNRIACVAPQYGGREFFSQAHLLAYLNGAALELGNASYTLIYVPVFLYGDSTPVAYPEFFSSISADGVIGIPGVGMPPEIDGKIAELGLPSVWLNRSKRAGDITTIEYDEQSGIEEFVNYLHREEINICNWFGPDPSETTVHYSVRLRYEGFQRALNRIGCKLARSYFVKWGQPLTEAARDYVKMIAGSSPQMTLCYNHEYWSFLERIVRISSDPDIRNMRLEQFASEHEYHYLRELGINQIRIPEVEMGRRGAQTILGLLEGIDVSQLIMPLPTCFVEYQSRNHISEGVKNAR